MIDYLKQELHVLAMLNIRGPHRNLSAMSTVKKKKKKKKIGTLDFIATICIKIHLIWMFFTAPITIQTPFYFTH